MDDQIFKIFNDKLDNLSDDISGIKKDVGTVREELGRYKGFLGGVTFVFTMCWTALAFFWDKITGGSHAA